MNRATILSRFRRSGAALALYGAAATWLATALASEGLRALLQTKEARTEFPIVAYRRLFLAGAIAAASVGMSCLLGGLWQIVAIVRGHPAGISGEGWGPLTLAVLYIASAIGIVRMRAWGVLVGGLAAAGSIVCALPVWKEVSVVDLCFVCVPGILLVLPLIASRVSRDAKRPEVGVALVKEPVADSQDSSEPSDVEVEHPESEALRLPR